MNLNKSLMPSKSIIHQPCFRKMKDHQKLHKFSFSLKLKPISNLLNSLTHAYQLFLIFCMLGFRTHVVLPHKHPEMYTLGLFGGLCAVANHQIIEQLITMLYNITNLASYHTQPTIFPMTISTHGHLATHTSQNTWFNSHYFYRALLSAKLLGHKSTKSTLL
jgi:hypothetical protein